MRWLLDQGLPRSTAKVLSQAGHDTVHAAEIGLAKATDSIILQCAAAERRIVATLDADFHAILASSLTTAPSVVRIRNEGMKGPEVGALLLQISNQFHELLEAGCVMTVRSTRVRYRLLPLS